ncbi:MAG TPA: SDR family oxidoreductase [Acidimicrobiales bacterium]|nr:SDR family oxidoreductase [Acidimicrobiales bacterium]
MVFDLRGRVALVTGAGQNVGAGIARMLAAQGARVAVNDFLPERARQMANAIGDSAIDSPFDVTDLESVLAGVAEVNQRLGPVDILVNNAGNGGSGGMRAASFREVHPAEWVGPVEVNLYGVMNCCKAVIDGMCDRGWGRIVTISSGAGTGGAAIGVSAYSAGKGGGLSFTRTLALEVARSGVTANSLALGLMRMEDPEITGKLSKSIPVGRTGTPEDVGAACVWLASDEAAWVTAQTIQINGGSIPT